MELEIIKWLGYALTAILGWFVRVLWTAQEKMRRDFTELEKNLPIAYVPRSQIEEVLKDIKEAFKDGVSPILRKLDRMEEKHDVSIAEIHKELYRQHNKDNT